MRAPHQRGSTVGGLPAADGACSQRRASVHECNCACRCRLLYRSRERYQRSISRWVGRRRQCHGGDCWIYRLRQHQRCAAAVFAVATVRGGDRMHTSRQRRGTVGRLAAADRSRSQRRASVHERYCSRRRRGGDRGRKGH